MLVLVLVLLAVMPSLVTATALLNVQSAVALALFGCATNLLVGYGGLVSFGQGAFYGTGAYVVALTWLHWQTSFWVSAVVAPVVGGLAALLVGLIALRTRRLYFALLTLAFTQLFYVVVEKAHFTGGANGIFGAILPDFLNGLSNAYYFTLVVVVATLLLLWAITRSPFGRTLRAIRENRVRAEALGVNVFAHQLLAFVISGLFCAIAGVLFVVHDSSANPDLLNWSESGYPVFMAVIGGQYQFLGPVVGAFIYEEGRDVVLANSNDYQLVFGLLLLAIVLFAPDGVLGVILRGGRSLWRLTRPGVTPQTRVPAASVREPEPRAPVNLAPSQSENIPAASSRATRGALLEVRDLAKHFEGIWAVDGVDLQVPAGTIHSVIGPNGAGKTTLFRMLTGEHRPTRGSVRFAGHEIAGMRPHAIARRGLSQSFQITNVFPRLSVLEATEVAVLARERRSAQLLGRAGQSVRAEASELLERVGLQALAMDESQALSHGDQRILEVALALATKPEMLLLDEPTAGMSPFETERMVGLVTRLVDQDDLTVLLSEHDMDVVFGISDDVTVMHQGRVIAHGGPEDLQEDERVMEVYLGSQP